MVVISGRVWVQFGDVWAFTLGILWSGVGKRITFSLYSEAHRKRKKQNLGL
jgi:hypothetical protein